MHDKKRCQRGDVPVLCVFGRTKHGVKKLARQLADTGYPVAALQGNLSQNARERVMADFRAGRVPVLLLAGCWNRPPRRSLDRLRRAA